MERITKFRAAFLLTLVGLVLCFFCIKLYAMQIADEGAAAINVTTYITRTRVRAPRGDILDTNGNVLVTNRAPVTRFVSWVTKCVSPSVKTCWDVFSTAPASPETRAPRFPKI